MRTAETMAQSKAIDNNLKYLEALIIGPMPGVESIASKLSDWKAGKAMKALAEEDEELL